MNFSAFRSISKLFRTQKTQNIVGEKEFHFQPTTFLSHPFLQSVYNIAEPKIPVEYVR